MSLPASSLSPSAFADILPMLAHVPELPADLSVSHLQNAFAHHAVAADDQLALLSHLQRWQKKNPVLNHPRFCLFASHYSDAGAAEKTQKIIKALQGNMHPLKQIAAQLNADLRLYELDLAHSHRTAEDAAQAMTYGMLAIEDKGDALVIGSLSDGAELSAQKITCDKDQDADALLQALAPQMGLDFFAAVGACLAARLASQPVILYGAFGGLLHNVLQTLDATAAAHTYLLPEATCDWLPVYGAAHALQEARFMMAFLPATHVQLV